MFQIEFRSLGIRRSVQDGHTLLDGARQAGIDIISPCGGKGCCGKCLVHVVTRDTNIPETRLACQTIVNSDLTVDIPVQSLFMPPKVTVASTLEAPFMLSMRDSQKTAADELLLGLAVDIGTTTIAGYLVDLRTGITIGVMGIMNPQIPYGDDVITRLNFAKIRTGNSLLLKQKAVEALDILITELCQMDDHAQPLHIREIVIVGNTAMHHILMNAAVQQLVSAPFTPSVNHDVDIEARNLGISASPGARVFLPPPVAGFIGSDHVAMLLAIGAFETQRPLLALDIGTNTEMSLVIDGVITSASCASGGAFEGSQISCGVRAAKGAIDHIRIYGSAVEYHTIDEAAPIGICGSGIFDALAQLVKCGIVDSRGRIQSNHPRVQTRQNKREFIIVDEDELDGGMPITITQEDIRALQMAKAAISTGIQILLRNAEIKEPDLAKIIVAGAFGSYLDLSSAITIGMLPHLPPERFHQVGNAAGIGAKYILVSTDARILLTRIMKNIRHIELIRVPGFRKIYLSALSLEEPEHFI
jgi:uncharacterized 2Fe-2S/4Fe-4S cluster protein (DUF4445 family)